MGKGGYGKGWSRGRSWHRSSQWQDGNYYHGWRKPAWQPESQHHDSSLSRLAGGMLTSAWDGVCSGVTAAALKAVEHTAGAFFNKDGKQTVDQGAQSIMACLAGSAADPPPAQMSAPAPKPAVPADNPGPDQLMLSVLEMQKQQMQQQTILQHKSIALLHSGKYCRIICQNSWLLIGHFT